MISTTKLFALGSAALTLPLTVASAQVGAGGVPPSDWSVLPAAAPTLMLATPDVETMLAEDALAPKNQPMRYGALLPLGVSPQTAGAWTTTTDGTPVWQLRIESPGAKTVSVAFDQFELAPGAELFVYNDDKEMLLGAFTANNNKANGQFAIQPVIGDALTLELMQPDWVAFESTLDVSVLVHDYVGVLKSAGGFKAGSCNIDVNCPEGANWQDEKRSVARTFSGGFLCSGALINNTENDGRQLFLTANHCGSMNNAVFLFNYERANCGSGFAPTNQSVQGSALQASGSNSDYRLVEITESIPTAYEPFYAGWNRSSAAPANTVGIHHPSGDEKKICSDNQVPSKNGSNWWIKEWDKGVTEGGSSGSPLFNPAGQIIGQLCCGQAACGFLFNDYYGRMDLSFSGMSSDLDPNGSGTVSVDGFDPAGGGPGGPNCALIPYGDGLGGANTGELSCSVQPTLGATMPFFVKNIPPYLPGLVMISVNQASIPLFGGTVLVDFSNPAVNLPFSSNFLGTAAALLGVPIAPALVGLSAFAQGGVVSAGTGTWTFTNGLEMTFCN